MTEACTDEGEACTLVREVINNKDYEAESNAVNTTFQSKGKNNVYAQKS